MLKKITILLLAFSILCSLTACGHKHTWAEADCEHPRTCSECGATEGEALGHDWTEADCTHPRTCTRCGKTEGEALGHTAGDWEFHNYDIINAARLENKFCTRCGEIVDTRSKPMGTMVEGDTFLFNPEQFLGRLIVAMEDVSEFMADSESMPHTIDASLSIAPRNDPDFLIYDVFDHNNYIGSIALFGTQGNLHPDFKDDDLVALISYTTVFTEEHDWGLLTQSVMASIWCACDPVTTLADAVGDSAMSIFYALEAHKQNPQATAAMVGEDYVVESNLSDDNVYFGFAIRPKP